MEKMITVYTVGCTTKDNKRGVFLIHHDVDEVVDMVKCCISNGRNHNDKEIWTKMEEMDLKTYVNRNCDNLTEDEIKKLLA